MNRPLIAATLFGLMAAFTVSASSVPAWAVQKKGKDKGKNEKSFDLKVENWGKPKEWDGKKDDVNAFWVWHDDNTWHFRTTGGGKGKHHFQGKIEVSDGNFVNLKGKKGEYGGKLVDRYAYNAENTVIAFDFKTDDGVDGLNFKVAPPSAVLKFTLLYDGKEDPAHIRLGRASDRPASATFTAPADPDGPGTKKGKK